MRRKLLYVSATMSATAAQAPGSGRYVCAARGARQGPSCGVGLPPLKVHQSYQLSTERVQDCISDHCRRHLLPHSDPYYASFSVRGSFGACPCSAKPSCPRRRDLRTKMFSRFASASRRAARHLSTAAAGDGSGFLIAGGVGVAAIACMAPRADEGHAAAPALPADEASKKLLAVLSHGEELAKIAKVKATMPDNIARRGVETKRRWRADDCDSRRPSRSSTLSTSPRWTRANNNAS